MPSSMPDWTADGPPERPASAVGWVALVESAIFWFDAVPGDRCVVRRTVVVKRCHGGGMTRGRADRH
jgi:hypothetical protein